MSNMKLWKLMEMDEVNTSSFISPYFKGIDADLFYLRRVLLKTEKILS